MTSIETLARNNPELTGRELFELQEQEKIEEKKAFEEENKEKLDLIKEINLDRDGGFYKGKFGDLYFLYHFMAVRLSPNGELIAGTIEKINIFKRSTSDFRVNIELDSHFTIDLDNLETYEKISRDEFFEVRDYFTNSVKKFW